MSNSWIELLTFNTQYWAALNVLALSSFSLLHCRPPRQGLQASGRVSYGFQFESKNKWLSYRRHAKRQAGTPPNLQNQCHQCSDRGMELVTCSRGRKTKNRMRLGSNRSCGLKCALMSRPFDRQRLECVQKRLDPRNQRLGSFVRCQRAQAGCPLAWPRLASSTFSPMVWARRRTQSLRKVRARRVQRVLASQEKRRLFFFSALFCKQNNFQLLEPDCAIEFQPYEINLSFVTTFLQSCDLKFFSIKAFYMVTARIFK